MTLEKQRHTVVPRTLICVFRNKKMLLMKFSGKGENPSQEKSARKDIYDPVGGHIEAGEDILENARREALEEAGVHLQDPKIKGIIHANGFAGKNIMLFVIVATTNDEGVKSTLEGELEWVNPNDIDKLNIFEDLKLIIEKVLTLKEGQTFTAVSHFEGFKLKNIKFQIS
jgi:8-oxo-dGTP diphosphatase